MKDLTKDAIVIHMFAMSGPIAGTLITQILYQLINLYFLLQLGPEVAAGASAASNILLLSSALTHILATGAVSLVSQAIGRKERHDANLVFNQSLSLSAALSLLAAVVFVALGPAYMRSVTADPATIEAGETFILWSIPGLISALPMGALSGSLRGMGIVRPTLLIYTISILINMVLAPLLITGWMTGLSLGVMGAGIATSISGVIGVVLLITYTRRSQQYLTMAAALLSPHPGEWRRILRIGFPAGSEAILTFASAAVTLHAISGFGPSAQAGFSLGQRILQAVLIPGISVAAATGPIAGQNFGARKSDRVRQAFRQAVAIGAGMMIVGTIFLQWQTQTILDVFDSDAAAVVIARSFLLLMSWTLVAQVLVYSCKFILTGLGNTLPSLVSSGLQFCVFAAPALWLSTQSNFRIEYIWYLSIGSMTLQALVSLWLLRREFRRSLSSGEAYPASFSR